MKYVFPTLLSLVTLGCKNGDESWMPLEPDAKWSYVARGDVTNALAEFEVADVTSVGSARGRVIRSSYGESRLAWMGTKLIASELGGTKYWPPIPLLDVSIKAGQIEWSGTAKTAGKVTSLTAVVRQSRVPYIIAQKEVSAIRTSITLRGEGVQEELTTWFVEQVGIAKQERRSKGKWVLSLSLVSGP